MGDINKIHLSMRKQNPESLNLDALTAATDGFSGAEIEQVIIASLYRCLNRKQPLMTEGVLDAIKSTIPLSVSRSDDIEELRDSAKGRFTPVA